MPKVPPVFAYVTQGRTEHLVTIIDKRVLQLLQENGKKKAQSSENKAGCIWSWEQLDPDSKIQIQWNTTGAKQPVVVSSVQLMKVEEQEGHRCFGGRSSGTARGRSRSSRSRLRRASATSTPSPATMTSAVASTSAAEPVPRPLKKRRVHEVVHQVTNNNNNNNNNNNQMRKEKEEANMILPSLPPPVVVNTSEEATNKAEAEERKRLVVVAEHPAPAHAQAQAIEQEKAHKKEHQQQQQRKEAEDQAQAQAQDIKRLAAVEQHAQIQAQAQAQKKEQQQQQQQQERKSREKAAAAAAVGEQQQQQHIVAAAESEAQAIANETTAKAQQEQEQESQRQVYAENAVAPTLVERFREQRKAREAAAVATTAAHQAPQRFAAVVANAQRVAAGASTAAQKKKEMAAAAATLKEQPEHERTRVVASAAMAAAAQKKKKNDAGDAATSDSNSKDEQKIVNDNQQRKQPPAHHHPLPVRENDESRNLEQNNKNSTLVAVEATSVCEGARLPPQQPPVASQQQPQILLSSTTTTTTSTPSNNKSNANNTDSLKHVPLSRKRKIIRTHTVASQQQQQQQVVLSSTTSTVSGKKSKSSNNDSVKNVSPSQVQPVAGQQQQHLFLSSTTSTTSGKKSNASNNDKNSKSDLVDREVRGLENLATFIANQEGGETRLVEQYRCRVTITPSTGRYEVNFFNQHGKRFRSMLEVGRFLNVVDDKKQAGPSTHRSKAATARKRDKSNVSTNASVINVPTSRKRKKYLILGWMEMYQRLLDYKKEHNDSTKVPKNYEKDPKLGPWVAEQRKLNNNNKLLRNRYSLLESIHFDWGTGLRRSNTDWMKTYQRLIVYQKEHDNSTKLPINYEKDPKLGSWVAEQRKSNNNNKLLPARFSLLSSIDFEWGSGPRGPNTDWMDMYQRLVTYKNQHLTTNVPFLYKEDLKLGRWVALQRTMKSNSSKQLLHHDQRCTLLDAIDFDWGKGPRGPQMEWRDMYQRLVVYQQQHSHTNVPFSYQADRKLGKWTNLQRVNYNNKNLPQERASLLDEIGFEWKEKKVAAVSKRLAVAVPVPVPVVISQQGPILDESSNVNNDDKGDLIMV